MHSKDEENRGHSARTGGNVAKLEHQLRALQTAVQELDSTVSSHGKRVQLNAVWLYVLFLVLVGGLAYGFVRVSQSGTESRIALLEQKAKNLRQVNEALQGEVEAWKNIENSLMELDGLIRGGQKELAVERFTQLRHLKFAGLLLHLVERFKREVAAQKYQAGKGHFDKGSFRRADDALQLSLRYESEPEYLGKLLYYRGMSLLRLKRFKESVLLLEKALNHGLPKRERLQARFHRAYAYDRSGRRRLARDHYRLFQRQHPKHPFAKQAKSRYEALKRR